jgi:6,7-dimethyl-8-ribityllumazine synthase
VKSYPINLDASGMCFGVVIARFNHLINVRLLESCVDELVARGAKPDDVHVAWVPGAFEIPLAAKKLAETGRYDALVALGAVVRGGTPHFDYVCQGVTDGVRDASDATGVPVAFGVLTTDDVDQALARARGSHEDKGREVAAAAVEMAQLCRALRSPPGGSS